MQWLPLQSYSDWNWATLVEMTRQIQVKHSVKCLNTKSQLIIFCQQPNLQRLHKLTLLANQKIDKINFALTVSWTALASLVISPVMGFKKASICRIMILRSRKVISKSPRSAQYYVLPDLCSQPWLQESHLVISAWQNRFCHQDLLKKNWRRCKLACSSQFGPAPTYSAMLPCNSFPRR